MYASILWCNERTKECEHPIIHTAKLLNYNIHVEVINVGTIVKWQICVLRFLN